MSERRRTRTRVVVDMKSFNHTNNPDEKPIIEETPNEDVASSNSDFNNRSQPTRTRTRSRARSVLQLQGATTDTKKSNQPEPKVEKINEEPTSIIIQNRQYRNRRKKAENKLLNEVKDSLDISALNGSKMPEVTLSARKRDAKKSQKKVSILKGGLFNGKTLTTEEDEEFLNKHVLHIDNVKDRKRRRKSYDVDEEDLIIQTSNSKDTDNGYYDNVIPNDYAETINDATVAKVFAVGIGLVLIAVVVAIIVVMQIFTQQETLWR